MVVATREGYKIFVDSEEKRLFDALVERLGTKQTTAATRLFQWFLAQDQAVQFAVLGALPDNSSVDVTLLVLDAIITRHRGTGGHRGQPVPRVPSRAPRVHLSSPDKPKQT